MFEAFYGADWWVKIAVSLFGRFALWGPRASNLQPVPGVIFAVNYEQNRANAIKRSAVQNEIGGIIEQRDAFSKVDSR